MTVDAVGRSWERRIEEIGARAEAELRLVLGYINDEVVPDVRRSGSMALRAAASELQRLAAHLDPGRATSKDEKEEAEQ